MLVQCGLAGLFLSAAEARAQGQARPDCLSVGIDAYAQGSLKSCVNDARNMAQAFESQRSPAAPAAAGARRGSGPCNCRDRDLTP